MTKRLVALATLALAVCLSLGGCRGYGETHAVWRTNFMGVWEYNGGMVRGKEINEEQIAKIKSFGMDCFLVLNERGTCRMNIYGVPLGNGTWDTPNSKNAELTFVKYEEVEDEEEEGVVKEVKERVEETRTFKLTYLEEEDQLLLKVDDQTSVRFAPSTLADMNAYIDSVSSSTPLYADGIQALDALMGKRAE